jgi:tripartite-type tricarboxylate transporter receptor subunit TctC
LTSWVGILAPAKTPSPIIQKLNTTLNEVLNDPDVKQRLDVLGVSASPGTPAAYGDQIKTDLTRYAEVVKAAKIKTE